MVVQRFTPILDLPITEQMMDSPFSTSTQSIGTLATDFRGTHRYIYSAADASSFYRYDCYKNIWARLPDYPLVHYTGSGRMSGTRLIFDPSRGTQGYVWYLLGGGANYWCSFGYYDIALNTFTMVATPNLPQYWTASSGDCAVVHPCTTYDTNGDDDAIFVIGILQTGAAADLIYKYTISTNTWSVSPLPALPNLPASVGRGCNIHYLPAWDSTKLVCIRGASTATIYTWDFKTPGGSWDTLTMLPSTEVYAGGTMTIQRGVDSRTLIMMPNGSAKLYDILFDPTGGNTVTVQPRAALFGPSWTVSSSNVDACRLAYIKFPDGSEYIYILGYSTTSFVRTQLQW